MLTKTVRAANALKSNLPFSADNCRNKAGKCKKIEKNHIFDLTD